MQLQKSCWGEKNISKFGFLSQLEEIIADRKKYNKDIKKSHSAKIANNIFEKDREIFEDCIDLNRELFEKFYQLN